MKSSKSLYYWFALFAICFIAYQQVIDNIRPNYIGNNLTVIYLLGIMPNFFSAIGIPALFLILIPQMKQTNKWLVKNMHRTANIISLTGLLAWEFIQAISKKLHFDWNDVIWTLIGALVFQLIWTLTPETWKEFNDIPPTKKGLH